MRDIPVPLPPAAEIVRLVEIVDGALSRAAGIRASLESQTGALETLRQATLARAFRGELVPTDAALAADRRASVPDALPTESPTTRA